MLHKWGAVCVAILALTACDAVRYPGDGRKAPSEVPTELPTIPVSDPYGNNPGTDTPDSVTPVVTPPADNDTDPVPVVTPVGSDVTDPVGPTEPPVTPVEPEGPDTPPIVPVSTDPDPVDPPPLPPEPVFSYFAPGQLLDGTGQGAVNDTIYAPDLVFPVGSAPAYLQSQVWMYGGGMGPEGGDQCDARNYAYPWRDNFCETRTSNRNSDYCPAAKIHQGQDIRVGSASDCSQLRRTPGAERALHDVVAVEDGVISYIGTYTVDLRAGPRIYRYMHMNMRALQVSLGQPVTAGQKLGYVSNDFGGAGTTFHLHFEIKQNTADGSWEHVPPYTSLVAAYERREEGVGEQIDGDRVTMAAARCTAPLPRPIPAGVIIDESFVMPDPLLVTDDTPLAATD